MRLAREAEAQEEESTRSVADERVAGHEAADRKLGGFRLLPVRVESARREREARHDGGQAERGLGDEVPSGKVHAFLPFTSSVLVVVDHVRTERRKDHVGTTGCGAADRREECHRNDAPRAHKEHAADADADHDHGGHK